MCLKLVYDRGMGPINFTGLQGKIKSARLLSDGSEIKVVTPWMVHEYPDDAFITLSARLPDEIDTVIETGTDMSRRRSRNR